MSLSFRSANKSDISKLVFLLSDDALGAKRENNSSPLNPRYLEAFNSIHNDPNNNLVVAMMDRQIVGMMQLTFIPYLTHIGSWRCLIEGVRIDKNFRGEGLGESMIKWAIQQAKDKQCRIIQLTSDKQRPNALHFYKKLGFKDSHEGFKLLLTAS